MVVDTIRSLSEDRAAKPRDLYSFRFVKKNKNHKKQRPPIEGVDFQSTENLHTGKKWISLCSNAQYVQPNNLISMLVVFSLLYIPSEWVMGDIVCSLDILYGYIDFDVLQ